MTCLLKFGKFHICLFTKSKQGLKLQIVGVQKVIFTLYPAPEFFSFVCYQVMPPCDMVSVTSLQTVLCLLLLAEGQTDSSKLVADSGYRLWCCYNSEGGKKWRHFC